MRLGIQISFRLFGWLYAKSQYQLANNYIVYRYQHERLRKANSTDSKIMSIVNGTNAQAKVENSNKNPDIIFSNLPR